jgi:hypothetical protein
VIRAGRIARNRGRHSIDRGLLEQAAHERLEEVKFLDAQRGRERDEYYARKFRLLNKGKRERGFRFTLSRDLAKLDPEPLVLGRAARIHHRDTGKPGKITVTEYRRAKREIDRERRAAQGLEPSISPDVAKRHRPTPQVLARAKLLAGPDKQITPAIYDRARLQLDDEQELYEEVERGPRRPAAGEAPTQETDIDTVIENVALCLNEKAAKEIRKVIPCLGRRSTRPGNESYFRQLKVHIRDGRDTITVETVINILADCIERNLEIAPNTNTWIGVRPDFALPGNERWSELDDVLSRYPKNNRRGTVAVDPTTRTMTRFEVAEQLVVGRGAIPGVRNSPMAATRPLSDYFDKPLTLIRDQIDRKFHPIKSITFFLNRFMNPNARPGPVK